MGTQFYGEQHAVGVAARKRCPRGSLRHLQISQCPADPLKILAASMHNRLPALVPVKYERMADNPLSFFRGAVPIMAADLAAHPHTGIFTQLCGDAHVANLGAYAAQDGSLVFDLNDFDETIQGPFERDVKRLATSLLLAARGAALDRDVRRQAVTLFTTAYRQAMCTFATMPVVELARFQVHRLAHTPPIPAIFRQARHSTPKRILAKLTESCRAEHTAKAETPGRCFRSVPPLQQVVSGAEAAAVLAALDGYRRTLSPERLHFFAQYQPVQVALHVVGTGSVGLRCYLVHFEGVARRPGDDPLFLQLKQEPASAYAAWLPHAPEAEHQGERVVNGQRMMQLVSDAFLGFTTIDGHDYVVRQFNDHKAALDLDKLDAATLHGYAALCGELLARGHARGGAPAAIAAYIGAGAKFERSILRFAQSYVRKNRSDWRALRRALRKGELPT